MGNDYEKGLYPPELMEEIRSRFEYVDWDPYSGKRIYLEAASGSLRPKSVIEAMLKQLGISSFIRLSAFHYNTPEEIELFLKATASFA